jgi:hypothetical protein
MGGCDSDRIVLAGSGGKLELDIAYPSRVPNDKAELVRLSTECSFTVGPITGRFGMALNHEDFQAMSDAFMRLLDGPAGTEVTFETLEQDIVLRCSVNKLGVTDVRGRINPRESADVVCTFVFEVGPTDLHNAVSGATRALQRLAA